MSNSSTESSLEIVNGVHLETRLLDPLQLYDAQTIRFLDWPKTQDGEYARRFLEPLVKRGLDHYFENIHAEIFIVKIADFVFPVIVTTENYQNSYVCLPFAHYFSYGEESIGFVKNRLALGMLKKFIRGLSKISRASKINSVVYVNNWLFSTDIYPNGITSEQFSVLITFLQKRFPDHATVFRSLNPFTGNNLMKFLKHLGCHLIASRQVYLTNTKNDAIFEKRIIKSDLKLRQDSHYEILDEASLSRDDYERVLNLYKMLYITQHSYLNPEYKISFVGHVLELGLFRFKVIKENGQLVGVAGYFERGGELLCPFMGYDKNLPDHTKIYRLLSLELLLEAKKSGLIFHQSAGSSFFKQIRGAESTMEYQAVFTRNLSFQRRFFWRSLKTVINVFAIPFMKHF